MFFDTSKTNLFNAIMLDGNVLLITESYNYLCHIKSNNLNDDDDNNKMQKILYTKSNALVETVHNCTFTKVKCRLLQEYGSKINSSTIWCYFNKVSYRRYL